MQQRFLALKKYLFPAGTLLAALFVGYFAGLSPVFAQENDQDMCVPLEYEGIGFEDQFDSQGDWTPGWGVASHTAVWTGSILNLTVEDASTGGSWPSWHRFKELADHSASGLGQTHPYIVIRASGTPNSLFSLRLWCGGTQFMYSWPDHNAPATENGWIDATGWDPSKGIPLTEHMREYAVPIPGPSQCGSRMHMGIGAVTSDGLPATARFDYWRDVETVTSLPEDGIGEFCPTCQGEHATVYVDQEGMIVGGPDDGTSYAGILRGSNNNDVIVGTEGNDEILAGNGDDLVCAGAGNDTVRGGNGNDLLFGEDGDDLLSGDNGDDSMFGGEGNDTLFGGNGNDLLCGGDGDDNLSGGNGSDKLDGGADTDVLDGGRDQDECHAGETNSACEQTVAESLVECAL